MVGPETQLLSWDQPRARGHVTGFARPSADYVEPCPPLMLTSVGRIHVVLGRDAGARMGGYSHGSERDLARM
jgi:hypothetical protein